LDCGGKRRATPLSRTRIHTLRHASAVLPYQAIREGDAAYHICVDLRPLAVKNKKNPAEQIQFENAFNPYCINHLIHVFQKQIVQKQTRFSPP
jgi:hypothetical protein